MNIKLPNNELGAALLFLGCLAVVFGPSVVVYFVSSFFVPIWVSVVLATMTVLANCLFAIKITKE